MNPMVMWSALCVAMLAGSILVMLAGLRSVRRLKGALRDLRALNASLEQRVAERTEQLQCTQKELASFAYSVSHDLRAPLRAIDGFSGFVEEGYGDKLDEEGRRFLAVIRANSQKMDRLITDVVTLSRATQSEMKPVWIDMHAMAGAVYKEMIPEEVRATFMMTVGPMPEAWGDPLLLRQVWGNLISNAVKFTSKSPVRQIEIGGRIENTDRVYSIKDSGAGFNPDYAGKLFGAFQRLHTPDEFEGTGMGLAIVQRIIHRHGGRVWAEGVEKSGATFRFSLPDRPPSTQAST
jgi:light-regulated signal transduction histidine kinase (bacteriophytochrome)